MAETVFEYKFDGRKGQFDVGWQQACWYDYKNIHIPIDRLSGIPTHWVFWEAEGQSYDADNQGWNRFKSPEQRMTWADFLPPHEHADLLNDIGQSYNWFHGSNPFHSRLARPTMLHQGQAEMRFQFFADWYKYDNGKVPISQIADPNHARVEMFIIDTGLNEPFDWNTADEGRLRHQQGVLQNILNGAAGQHTDWLVVNPSVGRTVKTRTVNVPRNGLFLCVFGVYSVWAVPEARGRNGLFVHSMGVSQSSGPGVPADPFPGGDQTSTPTAPTHTIDRPGAEGPRAEATSQRGKPRLQYERTFQLIHNSVPDSQAAQIFLSGYRQGKTTGTSADDAGIGDLDVKIVEVHGWPTAERNALVAWFNQHYPGTQVRFMN